MQKTHTLQIDSSNFNFDYSVGFEMLIAKEWNVMDVVDISKNFEIYDSDLRSMRPSKYGIRLFYKPVIPMCYFDPDYDNVLIKTADNPSYRGDYFDFSEGVVIGSPVCKMSDGSSVEIGYGQVGYHGLLISDDVYNFNDKNPSAYNENYKLPDDRQLNHTYINKFDFAEGSSIDSLMIVLNNSYQQQLDSSHQDVGAHKIYLKPYTTLSNNLTSGAVSAFQINNGFLSYTVSTDAGRLNIPTDNTFVESKKYLMPKLFKPFGAGFLNKINEGDTVGWLYCVFGVKELSTEDEDFDNGETRYITD